MQVNELTLLSEKVAVQSLSQFVPQSHVSGCVHAIDHLVP